MKYNLQQFDRLILNDSAIESEEVNIIIEAIKETAFGLKTKQEITLFIQNHQLALLEKKNYNAVCDKCDIVLYFLETYFCDFINDTLQISDIGKAKFCITYAEIINNVRIEMKATLGDKLFLYMQPLLNPKGHKQCTVYHIRYLSQFWRNWLPDFNDTIIKTDEKSVVSHLISQNFNPPAFFKFVTGDITGELDQEDNPYIQEQILISYNKRLNMIPAKIGNPFRPDYPAIKPMLSEWLKTEIKERRKKQKNYNPEQLTINPKKTNKIETSMSVAQIAYLFKLFDNTGIITNKTQTEPLHVIHEKFRSKKAETISYDSLHNKYYNVEDRTKESVKEILKKIISTIESN